MQLHMKDAKASPRELLRLFVTAQHHTWCSSWTSCSDVRLLSTSQMISALGSIMWCQQLSCAQALRARAVSCSAQSQHRHQVWTSMLVTSSQVVPSHLGSYCSSRPAHVHSACENCHLVQTSEKLSPVNFSSFFFFDKICEEQLFKQLFQQIWGVVSSEREQWWDWDAWDGIPACHDVLLTPKRCVCSSSGSGWNCFYLWKGNTS